jgi:anti-anti-sigma factor
MKADVSKKDSFTVITLAGNLDAESVSQLETLLIQMFNRGNNAFVLVMQDVPYVCSSGLRILLHAHKTLASCNGSFCLVGITKQVREILDVTGLSAVFKSYATLDEACAAR